MLTAKIFDIQHFSVDDGPGIRTVVFFSGCPLSCMWCHNPEGLSATPNVLFNADKCTLCGRCADVCEQSCHSFSASSHLFLRNNCINCHKCVGVCTEDALRTTFTELSVDDVFDDIIQDSPFYSNSNGGITLSGGEPLLQAEFCVELLSILKGRIHTAIETSGYAKSEDFKKVIHLCDFVYMDIKLADSEQHKKCTGVDNKQILENAEYLKQSGIPHTFRTPLIPNITDMEENLSAIERIVKGSAWEKLDYNPLAGAKYASVGRKFTLCNEFKKED